MPFVFKNTETFTYASPQEMYQDNKLKKIMGPLDYQSAMLDSYMDKIEQSNIAVELPTGSGKTLVGLLAGEYRRRKNGDKVVYLCPTNQLVNQVVEQAKTKFGLNAIAFCGKQKDYLPKDKSDFNLAEAIGVTTYSSFFAMNSFFSSVEMVIMDDVHSSEDYILSNWTVQFDKSNKIFKKLANFLNPYIGEIDFNNLVLEECSPDLASWSDLVPMPAILDKINMFSEIVKEGIEEGTSNYYAFSRISENLQDCNVFLSNGNITIRPLIAPTMLHDSFANAKQRFLMSATLGQNGELERITGIKNIYRLPIVNNWDKKGLGRKFFLFPDLAFDADKHSEVVVHLQKECKKSVCIVPDLVTVNKVKSFFEQNISATKVYTIENIEKSKNELQSEKESAVILANRFDGIDFADDESRLLILYNFPKMTNIQEKFMIYRMGAYKLFSERIKTRIIQAVGRCSRNPSDFSVVCVLGESIYNDFTKKEKVKMFPPELRAEIDFGIDNSREYQNIDQMIEQVRDFLLRNEVWQGAENYIVKTRNSYLNERDLSEEEINKQMSKSSLKELNFQYSIWKKDYKAAYGYANEIVETLTHESLKGYRCYWCYMAGSVAYYLYKDGQSEYKQKSIQLFSEAKYANISIKWLANLSNRLFSLEKETSEDDLFYDCIERIENVLNKFSVIGKLNAKIDEIKGCLKSTGVTFERGQQMLGEMLGYISKNPEKDQGCPDPYWIINENLVIVSEDKIYGEKGEVKEIPIKDISESLRHPTWIKEKEKKLAKNVEIINIFITNSEKLDKDAKIYVKDIYYVNRDKFVEWADKVLKVIKKAWMSFTDSGDIKWREAIHSDFMEAEITPKDVINFLCKNSMEKLAEK